MIPIDRLRQSVTDLQTAEQRYNDLAIELTEQAGTVEFHRQERDDAIRWAREQGLSYRDLAEATGLSRARLDQIRRGTNQ